MVNLATFDLNLLRVFDAVMRERSVTRAGTRLALSQPAVSGSLARLRRAMGDPLFVRIGNEMIPTRYADGIASAVREILSNVDIVLNATGHFDPASAEDVFTLRGADFFSTRLMPHLFERMTVVAPHIRLRFLDSGHGDLAMLLQDRAVDIALDRPLDLPPWVSRAIIFPSPFIVIASKKNEAIRHARLARDDVLPIDLYCELPHALRSVDGSMRGVVDEALAAVGRQRRVVLALPHFHAVAKAVARGRVIATVPIQLASYVKKEMNLATFTLPFSVPVPEVQMYWHSRDDGNARHRWLREFVTGCVDSIWPDCGALQ